MGLVARRGPQAIGVLDFALAPGLLVGRPRWPWLAARAVVNLAMAGYTLGQATSSGGQLVRARTFAGALLIATFVDSAAAAATRRPV